MARPTRNPTRRGGNPALKLAAIRRWHSYLGVFIAPSVIVFALTGSLQVFRLHEPSGGYTPPALIEKLGRLHKDQVFAPLPPKPAKPAPPAGAPKPAAKPAEHAEPAPKPAHLALQWFAIGLGVLLATSTALGLWMALAYSAQKGRLLVLLLLGVAVPAALVLLG
ncbi:hypothetical protein [Phenylobacterium hankyongense]|uniref:hypothetical protein n=1 Tax=Phenylobacterium hankyongense TaxID=1813876 RepID=UPI00105768B7|nr:hypothetical protein [Phenylobacterium hankyongense]